MDIASTSLFICFCQDLLRTFSRFIFSLFITMPFFGQALAQAPHRMQNLSSTMDLLSTMDIALQGHISAQAWQVSPLHSKSSLKIISPSNGLVTVTASTGQISWHHPQFIHVSSSMKAFPVISASTGFISYAP